MPAGVRSASMGVGWGLGPVSAPERATLEPPRDGAREACGRIPRPAEAAGARGARETGPVRSEREASSNLRLVAPTRQILSFFSPEPACVCLPVSLAAAQLTHLQPVDPSCASGMQLGLSRVS